MPTAASNGIELYYETFGDPDDPPLLLVNGLGGQLISWDVPFCEGLVDRGFFVIRYDNRDVGLSTHFDVELDVMAAILGLFAGEPPARRTSCRTWPPTASACSTTWASIAPTSSACRWAG